MKVLRPDPAEYVEVYETCDVRAIDVLSGALAIAGACGLTVDDLYRAAWQAESIRDFSRLVNDACGRRDEK